MFLSTGSFTADIGPESLLDAFFDTIGCRLEPAGRATRFPAIMGEFYEGVLMPKRAPVALAELTEIENGLRALSAAKIVGLKKPPERGNAYEWLSSPDGRPLADHIRIAIEESLRNGMFLQVSASRGNRVQLQMALLMALFGALWVFAGRRFWGNWILVSPHQSPDDHSGLYVWTLGFLFVAIGLGSLLTTAVPPLRIWFQRRKWATLTVALTLVSALIYFGMSPR